MTINIGPDGTVSALYTEDIDLAAIGTARIARASHVEPTASGEWTADMSPSGGPLLGPYTTRSAALAAEVEWIEAHVLGGTQ